MQYRTIELTWVWRTCLAVFILAGSTGALYRFGLAYGWTAGFDLVNIRHAHSHTMYFGWVTPALFALIASSAVREKSGRIAGRIPWILAGCFAAAAVSYPLFLQFGYSLVALGSAQMPIAVIGSTLNMVAWWAFVSWYVRGTRGLDRRRGHFFFDAALVFLVLATLGAGGLALLKPLGVEDPTWTAALTHMFVDYFAEGWFVLGVLGLAHLDLLRNEREPHWSFYCLLVGIPFSFALGMPSQLIPGPLEMLARIGGGLVGIGLLTNVLMLWRANASRPARWIWGIPLALLALKSVGQVIGSAIPGTWLADIHGLRILYLHLMLLGFVSLGLVAAAGHEWGERVVRGRVWMYGAVVLVLVSLVPLTPVWPASLGGRWAYVAAAWTSLAPLTAAAAMIARSRTSQPGDHRSARSSSEFERISDERGLAKV